MPLPGALASINKRAVAAAKAGNHGEALRLFDEVFLVVAKQHTTHPELYIAYSNRAASHLALQHHAEALEDAQQCVLLLRTASAHGGLLSCSRHPYWPKACQRLGAALLGLKQHQQAVTVFEAGLSSDPLNHNLKLGLQQAQQGLVSDLLNGKVHNYLALPAPPTPERITLAPHNSSRTALQPAGYLGMGSDADSGRGRASLLGAGRKYAVGWDLPAEQLVRYAEAGELTGDPGVWGGGCRAGSTLPRVLLSPATALADTGLKDVYGYFKTQCDLQLPKKYLHRQLPDTPRLTSWCSATVAAVQAVVQSGRSCRVLLLGAKAGVLAVAAFKAGATHVTCVETCPHMAAACRCILQDNGLSPTSFHVTTTHPPSLKLGTDLPTVCNLLIADIIDDGVLSGGFIPAVAHALDELMVREDPVIVPAAVTVKAQAVGLRASGCWTVVESDGTRPRNSKWLDLSALDQYRWTPSQALPSPLDPAAFKRLSAPYTVWHMPSSAVAADISGVKVLDVEFATDGSWCGVAFWAEMQLYQDTTYSTAGPWNPNPSSSLTSCNTCNRDAKGLACDADDSSREQSRCSTTGISRRCRTFSQQPAICWLEGEVTVKQHDVYPLIATHNTIRFLFTLQEADYSRIFIKEPSFPHGHFAMAADQQRISAYYRAVSAAMNRAAANKQQQQGHTVNGSSQPTPISFVDVGCGSGVLSLLVAAAAAGPIHTAEPQPTAEATTAATVVAADYAAPVAAVALRNVAANGYSEAVSVVHGDAATLQRGVHVTQAGADVILFDVFDPGLIGHQLLPLIETVKAKLLAERGQVLPASATIYMMGVEISTCPRQQDAVADKDNSSSSNGLVSEIHTELDLSALEQYRWSGESETVLLHQLPHNQLTRPVKLFDFDFCQPVGAPYPTETVCELVIVESGKLNAVVVWFDLHLDEGVSITSAPEGFTTGGRAMMDSQGVQQTEACTTNNTANGSTATSLMYSPNRRSSNSSNNLHAECSSADDAACTAIVLHPRAAELQAQRQLEAGKKQQQQQDDCEEDVDGYITKHPYWGQSLRYLDDTAVVKEGDVLQMMVKREGSILNPTILPDTETYAMQQPPIDTAAPQQPVVERGAVREHQKGGCNDSAFAAEAVNTQPIAVSPAPRPPWLKPGAGIEDPNVWAVKKCKELLGQMLQRAPGGKFPPIYKDLELMQAHAGSLGLDAAVLGAVTQELTMQEALAVAAQRQMAVSLASSAEAAGIKPPAVWR